MSFGGFRTRHLVIAILIGILGGGLIWTLDRSRTPHPANGSGEVAVPGPPPIPSTLEHFDPLIAERVRARLKGVEATPNSSVAWLDLAQIYHANGYVDEAVTCYRTGLGLDSNSARAWYWLGLLQEQRQEIPEALDSLERAAVLAPSYAPPRWRAGMWLLDMGDVTGAAEQFTASTEADSAAEAGWFGLARVHLALEEPDKAIEILEERSGEGANAGYARQLLATAYRQLGEPGSAAALMSGGLTAVPHWNDQWLTEIEIQDSGLAGESRLADRLIEGGRHEEALELLADLRARWPDEAAVYTYQALAHDAAGRREESVQALRDGLAQVPDNVLLRTNLARILAATGGTVEALELVARAVELEPQNAGARQLNGSLLAQTGRHEEAIAELEEAVTLAPDNRPALYSLGRLHAQRGEWRQAEVYLERLVELDPSAGPIWGTLTSVRLQLGEIDQAQVALDRAAEWLSPDHPQVEQLQVELDRLRFEQKGDG